MSEFQPDLLGGKGKPGRRTPKIRRNARPRIVPAGHADTPGSGPAGETCGSCTYMRDYSFKKTYHKCGARPGDVWKGGRATDIRPLDAACSKWAATISRMAPPGIMAGVQMRRDDDPPPLNYQSAMLRGTPAARISVAIGAALRAAPDGLTADQVAEVIGVDLHVVRPRISELAGAEIIEKTGDRRAGNAGRSIAVWKLKGGTEHDQG